MDKSTRLANKYYGHRPDDMLEHVGSWGKCAYHLPVGLIREIRLAERERCAKTADHYAGLGSDGTAECIAAKIRSGE